MSETDFAEIFDGNLDIYDEDLEDEMEDGTEGEAAEEAADEVADTEVGGGDPAEAEGAADRNAGGNGQPANDPEGVRGSFDPEMQTAIRAEAQKQINAFIEREFAGVVNPYTKAPIRTEADLTAYRQAFEAERQRQQLEEMGVNKEMLDTYIQNHPAMQQAQQVIRQQQERAANDFAAKEFAALKKEYPDCGLERAEQLWDTEAGKRALNLWSKGIPMVDAYAATHREEIRQRQSAAAKQAAMNEMNSKGHLKQSKVSGASGGAEMPADVLKSYRAFFRDATDEEIRAMWEKNQKY